MSEVLAHNHFMLSIKERLNKSSYDAMVRDGQALAKKKCCVIRCKPQQRPKLRTFLNFLITTAAKLVEYIQYRYICVVTSIK